MSSTHEMLDDIERPERQAQDEHDSLRDTDLVEVLYELAEAHSEETHGRDYREKAKQAMSEAIVQWTRDNLSIGGRVGV